MIEFILGAVLPPLVLSLAAGFVVRRYAPTFGLVDRPGARKVHLAPTPLGGGLAIWLGVTLPLVVGLITVRLVLSGSLTLPLPDELAQHLPGIWYRAPDVAVLLGLGTVLMLLGLVDDRRGLDWRLRLAVQAAVGVAVVLRGWRLTAFVDWPLVTGALSVLWVVGLINSFNMLDNMDGLSGGVAAMAASLLAAVLLLGGSASGAQPQLFIAGLLLTLVGALLGFLWHNRPAARLFMGDAGSYFVGFNLAVATMLATYAGEGMPAHAILAPVCVLAVPLYDTATVVWIRLRQGHSPFHADKNHLSHRLVELGLSKPQAVLTIYLLTATCGLGALLLHQVNGWGATVIGLLVLCILLVVAILEVAARRLRRSLMEQTSEGNRG